MTATDTAALVAAVREHAKANYESGGWSFIVEAWDDEQIAKAIGVVRTPAGAIKKLAPIVSALAERAGLPSGAAKPDKADKAPKVPHACRCGCGRTCLGTFAQGHDARWVSLMKAAVLAGDTTDDMALAEVLAVSGKLHDKLRHSLDLHAAAVAKRETAQAQAAQAKADKAAADKQAKADAKAAPATTEQADQAKAA